MVYVYKEEGPQAVKMGAQLCSRRPIHSTALGKAYASALPDGPRNFLLSRLDLRAFTPNTPTDPVALEAELLLTRERGYAIDNFEGEEGVACFAAPVLDCRGLPVAAISVAGPCDRILPRGEKIGPLVAETAFALSRRLGHVQPTPRRT